MRKQVLLLNYSHSAIKGMTHEVREDRLMGFGLFFGTKQTCLQWISDTDAECTNLAAWGAKLPAPQLFAGGRA